MAPVPRSRPGSASPLARLTATVEAPIVGNTIPPDPVTRGKPKSVTPDSVSSDDGPRYLRLVRKEARLRVDQVDALAVLRRQLARQRTDRAEILTDNTLIRIAVDLLLTHTDRLHGDTEDELRNSVTRNSVTRNSVTP